MLFQAARTQFRPLAGSGWPLLPYPTIRRNPLSIRQQMSASIRSVPIKIILNNYRFSVRTRLVELALALALKPVILILDEPAAGVPTSDSQLIIDAIERLPQDLAVLIIEHDMNLVFKVATSIIVLVMGEILIEGRPEEIATDPRVRELYLGQNHG